MRNVPVGYYDYGWLWGPFWNRLKCIRYGHAWKIDKTYGTIGDCRFTCDRCDTAWWFRSISTTDLDDRTGER